MSFLIGQGKQEKQSLQRIRHPPAVVCCIAAMPGTERYFVEKQHYLPMGRFITVLKEQDGVFTEFDEGLWSSLVEKLVVRTKTDVTVVFKDGTEIKAE